MKHEKKEKDCTSDIPGSHVELPPTSDLVVGLIPVYMVIGLPARNIVVGLATRDIVGSTPSTIRIIDGLVPTNVIKRPSGHRSVRS